MENASKALIIAGAILLSILIIGVGIFIFTSAQGTIDSSLQSMTTQEVNSFNSQFTSYQGDKVSGSNVKALLTNLAGNYASYKDEPAKVPEVDASSIESTLKASHTKTDGTEKYNENISKIRNKIVDKHTYSIVMNFGEAGVIDSIVITDVTNGATNTI